MSDFDFNAPASSGFNAGLESPARSARMRGCDRRGRLMGYWKLDELTSPWRDSVGSAHLTTLIGTPTVEPGIIGNGVRLYDGPGPIAGTLIGKATNHCYGFNYDGWTICGWFKFNCLSQLQAFPLLLFASGGGTIRLVVQANAAAHTFDFYVFSDPFEEKVLHFHSADLSLFNNQRNFYRAWLTPGNASPALLNHRLYLQLNNGDIFGPSNSDVDIYDPHDSGVSMYNFATSTGDSILFDETGYWTRMLSDSEAAGLWNDGDGVTFPNVPR